jgi:hypothetical protein
LLAAAYNSLPRPHRHAPKTLADSRKQPLEPDLKGPERPGAESLPGTSCGHVYCVRGRFQATMVQAQFAPIGNPVVPDSFVENFHFTKITEFCRQLAQRRVSQRISTIPNTINLKNAAFSRLTRLCWSLRFSPLII